mmetsp:Transcript_3674/g.8036  ORF Transcript_3674/g.8036 Transcript_3674/m.8036 type:complete len:394 (-) Transcript_3674:45-1226(-)
MSPVDRAEAPSNICNIGRDCQKCLSYLTRALDQVGERPQSLLRALGVITHKDNDSNGYKLYEPTEDGRGVLISLEKKKREVAVNNKGLVSHDDGGSHMQKGNERVRRNNMIQLQGSEVSISRNLGDNDAIPSPAPNNTNDKQSISDTNGNDVTLVRRFTKAAHLLADGIRHSTEDIINNNDGNVGGIVLTTSPAVESSTLIEHQNQVEIPNEKSVTTIVVECQVCGSDTRAEAGARAFVRGPEPLSIVLCSNRLSSQREVDEVLIHELVHIYDVHSRKMDLRDCHQLARSEVRAAREAECSNSFTQFTANICVKDKATVATRNMFPEDGKQCVCDVFTDAMNDMAPFEGDGRNNPFFKAGCAKGSSSPVQQSNSHADFTSTTPPFSSPRQSDR